jgi:hypothetical protein
MMRRIISLVVSICLTAVGAFATIYLITVPQGDENWIVVTAGFMYLLGIGGIFFNLIDA